MILEGKYEELTFKIYSDSDTVLTFFDESEKLIKSVLIKGGSAAQTVSVSVSGVEQLTIHMSENTGCHVYLVNMRMK